MTSAFKQAASCKIYNFLIKTHCSRFLKILFNFSEWLFSVDIFTNASVKYDKIVEKENILFEI